MIRNLKLTAIASLTVLSLVAGGCAGPESHTTPTPTPSPDQPGTPQGPGEPIDNTPPPTAKYAGVYSAVAPIDLTQNGVLPGVLGPALGALIELHDHPGKAILDIVAIANIPTVSDAVKNMPGVPQGHPVGAARQADHRRGLRQRAGGRSDRHDHLGHQPSWPRPSSCTTR